MQKESPEHHRRGQLRMGGIFHAQNGPVRVVAGFGIGGLQPHQAGILHLEGHVGIHQRIRLADEARHVPFPPVFVDEHVTVPPGDPPDGGMVFPNAADDLLIGREGPIAVPVGVGFKEHPVILLFVDHGLAGVDDLHVGVFRHGLQHAVQPGGAGIAGKALRQKFRIHRVLIRADHQIIIDSHGGKVVLCLLLGGTDALQLLRGIMDFPADVLPGAVVHVIQPAVPAGGHAIDLRQPRAGVDPVVQGGHGPPQGEMIVKPVLRALGRKGPGPMGQGAVFSRVPGEGRKQHAPGGQGGKPQEQQHRKITEQFSVSSYCAPPVKSGNR